MKRMSNAAVDINICMNAKVFPLYKQKEKTVDMIWELMGEIEFSPYRILCITVSQPFS